MPTRKQIIQDHMREIGRKGGKAGKGSPKRKAASLKAANARWRSQHPVPNKV